MDRPTRVWITWYVVGCLLVFAALGVAGSTLPAVRHLPWWAIASIVTPPVLGVWMLAGRAERTARR